MRDIFEFDRHQPESIHVSVGGVDAVIDVVGGGDFVGGGLARHLTAE